MTRSVHRTLTKIRSRQTRIAYSDDIPASLRCESYVRLPYRHARKPIQLTLTVEVKFGEGCLSNDDHGSALNDTGVICHLYHHCRIHDQMNFRCVHDLSRDIASGTGEIFCICFFHKKRRVSLRYTPLSDHH